MTDRYKLNETRSPIDPSSWSELNENWDLIKSYLRFLERQIKFLAGGNEIDDILLRIDTAIANAENATADVEQARTEFNSILNDLNTLVTNAETATENANNAASNANELNNALSSLKVELEALQTNLNGIVQAEAERVANEQSRSTAEQTRATDETTRRENEAARVLKEQSRENAEQTRITTFDAQMMTAEQKITMMQYLIDNLKSYDFDLSTTYNFPNLIKWNGSTFIALKEVTGLTPTDDGINYRLVAQRGVDGTGAVSSVNGMGPDASGNVEVIMALVNNLVSDSTTEGLTAAQGKALKVLFDELQQAFNLHGNATDNPHGVTAEQLALGNVQNFGVATQAEAEDGIAVDKYMTSQRTKQAIDKNLVNISQSIQDVDTRVTEHLDEAIVDEGDQSINGILNVSGLKVDGELFYIYKNQNELVIRFGSNSDPKYFSFKDNGNISTTGQGVFIGDMYLYRTTVGLGLRVPSGNDYAYYSFDNKGDLSILNGGIVIKDIKVLSGAGNPEGAIVASTGSLYLSTSGTIYIKANGSGNTGWVAK